MNRAVVAKSVLQGIAIVVGLVGSTWAYIGMHFVILQFEEPDSFVGFFMVPLFLIMGGILLYVAYQTVRRFSAQAIRNLFILLAYAVYSVLLRFLGPYEEATRRLDMKLHHAATFLFPLLIAILFYKVMARALIKLTLAEEHPKI